MTWIIFILAFFLNWVWEVAQLTVYEGFKNPSSTYRLIHCLPATIMDALFIVGMYYAGRVLLRDRQWISHVKVLGYTVVILIGAVAAVLTEKVALKFGWWSYGPDMPRLPLFGIGLLPVAQLSCLPVITFLAARWLSRKKTSLPS
jgi:hypothetical protein